MNIPEAELILFNYNSNHHPTVIIVNTKLQKPPWSWMKSGLFDRQAEAFPARCDAPILFIWVLRLAIMGLPSLHVCVHMCIVCVALSMRRQLHCCAPLSLTFLEAQVWSQHLQLLLPATQRLLSNHQMRSLLGFRWTRWNISARAQWEICICIVISPLKHPLFVDF